MRSCNWGFSLSSIAFSPSPIRRLMGRSCGMCERQLDIRSRMWLLRGRTSLK